MAAVWYDWSIWTDCSNESVAECLTYECMCYYRPNGLSSSPSSVYEYEWLCGWCEWIVCCLISYCKEITRVVLFSCCAQDDSDHLLYFGFAVRVNHFIIWIFFCAHCSNTESVLNIKYKIKILQNDSVWLGKALTWVQTLNITDGMNFDHGIAYSLRWWNGGVTLVDVTVDSWSHELCEISHHCVIGQ